MKSFEDFMKTIDVNDIAEDINRISPPEIIVSDTSPEALAACINSIYNKAVIASVNIALLYLRKYHEWLEQ